MAVKKEEWTLEKATIRTWEQVANQFGVKAWSPWLAHLWRTLWVAPKRPTKEDHPPDDWTGFFIGDNVFKKLSGD